MMNEKRFELTEINPSVNPLDTVCFIIDYENPSKNIRNLKDCVDLLNEQQATIEQKDKQLQKAKEYFMDYLSREMSANNFSELWDLVINDE